MKWWKNCTFPSPVRVIDYGPFRGQTCKQRKLSSAMCFQRKRSHIVTGIMNPKRLTLTIHNYVHKNSRNTPSHLCCVRPHSAIHCHPQPPSQRLHEASGAAQHWFFEFVMPPTATKPNQTTQPENNCIEKNPRSMVVCQHMFILMLVKLRLGSSPLARSSGV